MAVTEQDFARAEKRMEALRRAGHSGDAQAAFFAAAARARASGDSALFARAAFGAHRVATLTESSRSGVIALLEEARQGYVGEADVAVGVVGELHSGHARELVRVEQPVVFTQVRRQHARIVRVGARTPGPHPHGQAPLQAARLVRLAVDAARPRDLRQQRRQSGIVARDHHASALSVSRFVRASSCPGFSSRACFQYAAAWSRSPRRYAMLPSLKYTSSPRSGCSRTARA